MDTAVKISVITVCYNAESVIEKTIRSVLGQTYEDLEYIIVDGASKDHTPDIIEGYLADTRVKYLSEPDKGIYDAMNKGAGMATGDYLEFLNAGDVLADDQVLSHIAERAGQSGADILYGDILYVNTNETTESVFMDSSAPVCFIIFWETVSIIRQSLQNGIVLSRDLT